MEFYTSGDFDSEDVSKILCDNSILANIYPMSSVVQDAGTGDCRVEHGAKVQVFSITDDALLALWYDMRKSLHIHCLWIEHNDYSGCICNWPHYLQLCADDGLSPLKCSEYS